MIWLIWFSDLFHRCKEAWWTKGCHIFSERYRSGCGLYWKMDRRGQNFVMSQNRPPNFVMAGQIFWPKDWLPNSLNSFALIKIGIICWVTFWKYGRIIFFRSCKNQSTCDTKRRCATRPYWLNDFPRSSSLSRGARNFQYQQNTRSCVKLIRMLKRIPTKF